MRNIFINHTGPIITPKPGQYRHPKLDVFEFNQGCIFIKEGVIRYIGSYEDMPEPVPQDTDYMNAKGAAIMPGFVDSHSHLVFGGDRADEFAMRAAGTGYEEIAKQGGGIQSTVKATRQLSRDDLFDLGLERLKFALAQGITTMEVKSGYGLDAESELKMLKVIHDLNNSQPVELTPTFLGAHAVPEGVDKKTYMDQLFEMMPDVSELTVYCDVFCEKGYFSADESRQILEKGLEYGLKPKIHTNQFHDIGGIEMAVDMGAVSADHLEIAGNSSIEKLAASETVATLLPGVSFFLNIPYAPARLLLDSGAITVLATDFNPGSSHTLSMQLLLTMACTQMRMSVDEAICCATQNGARALEMDTLGCVAVGYQADLLMLNTENYHDIPYFFGENHIQTVLKKGEVVWSRNH